MRECIIRTAGTENGVSEHWVYCRRGEVTRP